MFESFFKVYKNESTSVFNNKYVGKLNIEEGLKDTIQKIGGASFNGGIYRVFHFGMIDHFTQMVEEYFIGLKNKVQVFGYDWLGRLFALDKRRTTSKGSEILLIEPGAGEAMEIPIGIIDFHNSILIQHPEEALALNFFNKWKEQHPEQLEYTDCVGYKVPLFLGGSDTVDNLEIIDLDVYFTICSQLQNKTLTLKQGQTIGQITIT